MVSTRQLSTTEPAERYLRALADPQPIDVLRHTIDDLVADDHVTYHTSSGTMVGREALKSHLEIARAAFPTLTYRIDAVARAGDTTYCRWTVDETHWLHNRPPVGVEPTMAWRTMAIRVDDGVVTETWGPCDPWTHCWSRPSLENEPPDEEYQGPSSPPAAHSERKSR